MVFARFHFRRWVSLGLIIASLGSVPSTNLAQTKPTNLYEAEAYLLYLFAMYTEWPRQAFADDRAPFVLGILGKDPFGKDIDFIKAKTVRGRALVIRYFSRGQEVQNCHILFVCASEKEHAAEIIKSLANASTLTISEIEGFTAMDGMINIFVEKTRAGFGNLKYDINQRAAEKARLRINSYVLAKAGRNPGDP
jgi:hypothetical protein